MINIRRIKCRLCKNQFDADKEANTPYMFNCGHTICFKCWKNPEQGKPAGGGFFGLSTTGNSLFRGRVGMFCYGSGGYNDSSDRGLSKTVRCPQCDSELKDGTKNEAFIECLNLIKNSECNFSKCGISGLQEDTLCFTCSQSICYECLHESHKGHLLTIMTPETRKRFEETSFLRSSLGSFKGSYPFADKSEKIEQFLKHFQEKKDIANMQVASTVSKHELLDAVQEYVITGSIADKKKNIFLRIYEAHARFEEILAKASPQKNLGGVTSGAIFGVTSGAKISFDN